MRRALEQSGCYWGTCVALQACQSLLSLSDERAYIAQLVRKVPFPCCSFVFKNAGGCGRRVHSRGRREPLHSMRITADCRTRSARGRLQEFRQGGGRSCWLRKPPARSKSSYTFGHRDAELVIDAQEALAPRSCEEIPDYCARIAGGVQGIVINSAVASG